MSISSIQLNEQTKYKPPLSPNALLSDDAIDRIINAQAQAQIDIKVVQPQQVELPQVEIPTPPPTPTSTPTEETNFDPELKFDMTSMHTNLNNIVSSTKVRIENLIKQQEKLNARINILEKFIKLDEKELALESVKEEMNLAKVRGLRKSIVDQTELFGTTLDILLKFESQIQSWTKTLMDVEKDKVSAYQKIKQLNKEQASTETDINDVLVNINNLIKSNPNSIFDQGLSISGYSGKKFNQ